MARALLLGFVGMVAAFAIAVSVASAQSPTTTTTPSPTMTPTPTGQVQGSTTVPEGAPSTGFGAN